jgi:hypothetical protein
MATIADLQTHIDAAIAANEAADYATALIKITSAELVLVAIADSIDKGQHLEFGRDLRSLKATIQQQAAASAGTAGNAGITTQKTTYVQATD